MSLHIEKAHILKVLSVYKTRVTSLIDSLLQQCAGRVGLLVPHGRAFSLLP